MRRFQQIVLIIMLLILALFVLIFILENQTRVVINFISFETPQLPLAILIVISFLLGLVLALVVNYLVLLKVRFKLTMAKKQLATCKKQLANQHTT